MARRTVTLRKSTTRKGSRSLTASLDDDGVLTIAGHDLGHGVTEIFGSGVTEYEWVWTLRDDAVDALLQALDSGPHPLDALLANFSHDDASDLKPFLDNHAIEHSTWSRHGD